MHLGLCPHLIREAISQVRHAGPGCRMLNLRDTENWSGGGRVSWCEAPWEGEGCSGRAQWGSEGCLGVLWRMRWACLGATHYRQHIQRMLRWRLAILQALLQHRRQGKRSLSSTDTGGRNCCLPSCCTQPLHRFHTLLLYQYLQLGSPVATALASSARNAGKGWEAWEGLLATPAGRSPRWVLPAGTGVQLLS